MGQIAKHEKVKLIIGLISRQEFLDRACFKLAKAFGKFDYKSDILDFDSTRYYEKEMGINLKRQFVTFSKLINPKELPEIKIKANKIENRFFTSQKKRFVNIDPGYLSLSKLVLATTKDHQHRIYLDKGIFGEVTLRYRGKTFCPWEWTYADYCKAEYIRIFNSIRNELFKRNKLNA